MLSRKGQLFTGFSQSMEQKRTDKVNVCHTYNIHIKYTPYNVASKGFDLRQMMKSRFEKYLTDFGGNPYFSTFLYEHLYVAGTL